MTTTDSPSATPSPNGEHFRQGLKLAISLTLFYWLALVANWELPQYGAIAIILVSLGTRGASLQKAFARIVGTTFALAAGFVLIAFFHHDRWAMLIAFCVYLTAVAYCMQGSPNDYAWYIVAFLPLVMWGSNYPEYDNTFYFGVFRWLQTATGVLIYTLVDLLFWPRRSGDQLLLNGARLNRNIELLLKELRQQIESAGKPIASSEQLSGMKAEASVSLAGVNTQFQQALYDTPAVSARKHEWQQWITNATAMLNALELAQTAAQDCGHVDLNQCVPQLQSAMAMLRGRVSRMQATWLQLTSDTADETTSDPDVPQPVKLSIDYSVAAERSDAQRAALAFFLAQLKELDRAAANTLGSLRHIAGASSAPSIDLNRNGETPLSSLLLRPKIWAGQRFRHALFPTVAFAAAFLVWIYVNPPAGARIPMIAGILALAILRTPMNPVPLMAALLLSIFLVVAPVYWLVMPAMTSPLGLLGLVFVYALLFGYLGGKSPILKMGPMMMFVNMVGISNQQTYSFQAMIVGALMVVIGAGVTAITYQFFAPLRPERSLTIWVDRFFYGCTRFSQAFGSNLSMSTSKQRSFRTHWLQSMVLPAPAKVQSAIQGLDSRRFPVTVTRPMKRLQASLQQISDRMIALEVVLETLDAHPSHWNQSIEELRRMIESTFDRWKDSETRGQIAASDESSKQLARQLQTQLETLEAASLQGPVTENALVDRYSILGSLRGLIDAMTTTQQAISQVDWKTLSAPRF